MILKSALPDRKCDWVEQPCGEGAVGLFRSAKPQAAKANRAPTAKAMGHPCLFAENQKSQ
jgi:hypothetical protein